MTNYFSPNFGHDLTPNTSFTKQFTKKIVILATVPTVVTVAQGDETSMRKICFSLDSVQGGGSLPNSGNLKSCLGNSQDLGRGLGLVVTLVHTF